MASRANLTWCHSVETDECSNPKHLCDETERNLSLLESLKARHPDRYYLLKYEDLNMDFDLETAKLFDFLDLPVTPSVRVFLHTHTRRAGRDTDPYSVYRPIGTTALAWRQKLSTSVIANISSVCTSVLKKLNYTLI